MEAAGINEIIMLVEDCTGNGGDPHQMQMLLSKFEFSKKTLLVALGMVSQNLIEAHNKKSIMECRSILERMIEKKE